MKTVRSATSARVRVALVVMTLGVVTVGAAGCTEPGRDSGAAPTVGPSATPSPSPSVSPTAVRLAPPSYRLASFPLKPTWEPASLGRRQVAFTPDFWRMTYRKGAMVMLEVTVAWQQPTEGAPSDSAKRVTISGRSARVEHVVIGDSDPNWAVMWQLGSGEWVMVTGRLSETDTLRYARGLAAATLVVTPPFTFALLPDRYIPAKVTDAVMEFVPPEPSNDPDVISVLGVWLRPTYHEENATPTTVNGRPAEFRVGPGGPLLAIDMGDGRQLTLTATGDLATMSMNDLITIATGVTISPSAGVTAG